MALVFFFFFFFMHCIVCTPEYLCSIVDSMIMIPFIPFYKDLKVACISQILNSPRGR